jgi:hypothetical protein
MMRFSSPKINQLVTSNMHAKGEGLSLNPHNFRKLKKLQAKLLKNRCYKIGKNSAKKLQKCNLEFLKYTAIWALRINSFSILRVFDFIRVVV